MSNLEQWVLRDATDEIIGTYKTYKGLQIAIGKREQKLFETLEKLQKEKPNFNTAYTCKLESV